MHRTAVRRLTITLLVLGLSRSASAQDPLARRASLFDLGLYAGGAWSTDWFELAGESYGVGVAPLVGAQATYWLSPAMGVRVNGAHMPSHPPEPDGAVSDAAWSVSNWLYDVAFVYRPWFGGTGVGQFRASTYFVTGVGGITSNTAGPDASRTSPAINLGIGATVARLSPRYALFGELGTFIYPGPVDDVAINRKTATSVVGRMGLRREWW